MKKSLYELITRKKDYKISQALKVDYGQQSKCSLYQEELPNIEQTKR